MPKTKNAPAPEVDETITAGDFDLLDFISSGSVARRTVTTYAEPGLISESEEVLARLAELGYVDPEDGGEPDEKDGPLAGGPDDDEIAELLARQAELAEQWEASKITWTVRAVSEEEVRAAKKAVPDPKVPTPPKDGAPEAIRQKYVEKIQEYNQAIEDAKAARKLPLIATAVLSVETARGSTDSVSVAQLEAMLARPHGRQWIDMLYAAVEAATQNEGEVARPTSPGRSTSTRG